MLTEMTVRILRSFPKCDDVSPVLAIIRREDQACKDITRVFDSKKLDQVQGILVGRKDLGTSSFPANDSPVLRLTSSAASSAVYPVHRTGNRSTNELFLGRDDILRDLGKVIRSALGDASPRRQSRIVITGMGGLGKSELCLQLTHQLQSL